MPSALHLEEQKLRIKLYKSYGVWRCEWAANDAEPVSGSHNNNVVMLNVNENLIRNLRLRTGNRYFFPTKPLATRTNAATVPYAPLSSTVASSCNFPLLNQRLSIV